MYAALIFFTRLPWWRFYMPPEDDYKRVVVFLTWVGWLTALTMGAVYWLASLVLPLSLSVLLAIAVRLLITGCLHEDGLADSFDGFGGGTSRERILTIMKDSHIGVYGVIGLVFYFQILAFSLYSFPAKDLLWIVFAADPIGRLASAELTNRLPYARAREESKAGVVYAKMPFYDRILACLGGILPLIPLAFFVSPCMLIAILAPLFVYIAGHLYFKRRIGGYTGDCCGALQIVSELSFLLLSLVLYSFR